MSRLLLIGWDAADWAILHPLIDAEEMPTLNRLVESGVSGQLLWTHPPVPAIQWTSIATGKRAWQHGIRHSREFTPDRNQVVPITARTRQASTLWEMLAREGKRSLVIGWPATHGEQNGNAIVVSDRYPEPTAPPGVKPWPPAVTGTYSSQTANEKLDELRVSPEEIKADIISRYIPEWKKIDQKRDRRIGQLRLVLASDFSIQAAASELLKGGEWDFAAVRFSGLGALSPIFLPHHPPKRNWIPEDEFQVYHKVISAHCVMLDLMLRRLIELAGKETTVVVVSGHGVQSRNFPPGKISYDSHAWKSAYGIFAAGGHGFSGDALVHGATVLDVAPTVLTWFGLPIGDDMEGRVLVEAFATATEIKRVESWVPVVNTTLVETPEEVQSHANAKLLRHESNWNFVQSSLEAGRHEEALPLLMELFRNFPERVEYGHAVFNSQLALKRVSDAEETLEVLLETMPAGVSPLVLRAELAWAKREIRATRSLVNEALQLNPAHPAALRKIGMLLLQLREWERLGELAKKALALDEGDPLAWLGLAESLLRTGHGEEASDAAQRAIGLKYFFPEAHFVLARALVAQGLWADARNAMQALMKIQPNHRTAANYLKRISLSGVGLSDRKVE